MADYGGNFQISHDKSLSERLYVMADTTQAGPSEPERGGGDFGRSVNLIPIWGKLGPPHYRSPPDCQNYLRPCQGNGFHRPQLSQKLW